MQVLALNSGSSSLKFGLYRVDDSSIEVVVEGQADAIGKAGARIEARDGNGVGQLTETGGLTSQRDAVERIDRFLDEAGVPKPDAIGHRIVHGGPTLRRHCLIDDAVLAMLKQAIAFAPLHAPPALDVIAVARERFASLPQVACFDTAFHADLDERSRVLPLPKALRDQGIERYGFHGLSCESIVEQLGDALPARVVVAHLGNGASVSAVRDGRSIDTSMGLTPTGGVIMGTRSGDLDPGVLLYLMREKGFDADRLEDLLDRRSGLLGISDLSSDMRELRAASSADARLAIAMFGRSVAQRIATMVVSLGGIDLLVFTGGIGEHDAATRATICSDLSPIGIVLDDPGRSIDEPLQHASSRCVIRVLPSKEDERIARHVHRLTA